MKVNRTFSIDLWIAKELKEKRNQSKFVCDAIKSAMDGKHVDVRDAECSTLMIFLRDHPDCDPFIKQAIETSLRTAYEHSVSNKKSLSS